MTYFRLVGGILLAFVGLGITGWGGGAPVIGVPVMLLGLAAIADAARSEQGAA